MNIITYFKEAISPGGTPKRYLIWVSFVLIAQLASSILPSSLFYEQQVNLANTLFLIVCSIVLTVLTIKNEKHQILAAYVLYIVGLAVSTITISQGITSLSGIIFMLTWAMTLFVAERREYISFDYVTVFMVLMLFSTLIMLLYDPVFEESAKYYVLWTGAILTAVNIYLVYIDFGAERNFYKEYRALYANLEKLSHKMSEILSSKGELDHLLGLVSKECIPLLNLEDCVIYLYNEDTKRLKQVAAFGNKIDDDKIINPLELKTDEGIVGKCFSTGKPILINETKAHEDYVVDDKFRRSELSVPIVSDGEVIGVIDSEHSSKGFFKERHIQAFNIIASFCGIKITEYKSQKSIEIARIAKEEVDRYKELDEMKQHFIANISHDLKTPLSLIKGPAIQINQLSKENKIKSLSNFIVKNADHLLRVVNQLLQLNRVDEGLNQLYLEQVDTKELLDKINEQYEGLALEKKITFITDISSATMVTDSFRLEQIVHNILHNSFRYTPNGGKIKLTSGILKDAFQLQISDNGPGIPLEIQGKIFERFYKADVNNHEGTGIGLSLVKEYVNSLGGNVILTSDDKSGTTFKINIPIYQKSTDTIEERELLTNDEVITENVKPIMLVAEDHADLNNFICSYFEQDFHCIPAFDGEDALKKINLNLPDVIISDLMMPKLDGNKLVHFVKSNEETAHIPIIILSAKDQLTSKVELYEKGVENYLTKPFDITELKAVVDSVLSQRRKLMDVFFTKINVQPKHQILSEEKKLPKIVQDTLNYVLENIENGDLNVSLLCEVLTIGRNKLQREIKTATGLTPVEFIRSLRLNEARKLLCDYKQNISEVAYAVGFNNLSYFSRSFKTEFGMLPSEWQEEQVNV
ncbi:MAG: ATP-binding protein [Brumimicrobium sp.]